MATQINRGNLVTVKIADNANASLRTLGYTQEQVDTSEQIYRKPVPGDAYAGSDGPPIDTQFTGLTTDIRLQLSKYDPVVAAELEAALPTATPGEYQLSDVGMLTLQDNQWFRVALACTGMPRNFPRCEVIEAIQVNRGTKFASFNVALRAYRNPDTNVLYDANIS